MTKPVPYEPAPGVQLYLADAREVVPTQKCDLVLQDPPYKLTKGGENNSHFSGAGRFSDYKNDGELVLCKITWPEIMQVTRTFAADRSDIFIMSDARNLREMLQEAHLAGIRHHNVCPWDKGNSTANKFYRKTCEYTFYGFLGNARTINNCGHKDLASFPPGKETIHPTEKPVPLMQLYIEDCSDPGDLVGDAFMGVGTTGVAAVKCGRRFVGVEEDERYFDIACRRIELALKERGDLSLFERAAPVPVLRQQLFAGMPESGAA